MPEFKKNPSPFMLKSGNSPLYKNLGSNWKGNVVTGFGKEADVKMTNLVKDQSVLSKYKHAKNLNPNLNKMEAVKNVIKKYGKKALNVGKVAGRVGSKFAGPVGAVVTAAEVLPYLYKNRKDIKKSGDKVMKKRYERSKSGFDPFTSKY